MLIGNISEDSRVEASRGLSLPRHQKYLSEAVRINHIEALEDRQKFTATKWTFNEEKLHLNIVRELYDLLTYPCPILIPLPNTTKVFRMATWIYHEYMVLDKVETVLFPKNHVCFNLTVIEFLEELTKEACLCST